MITISTKQAEDIAKAGGISAESEGGILHFFPFSWGIAAYRNDEITFEKPSRLTPGNADSYDLIAENPFTGRVSEPVLSIVLEGNGDEDYIQFNTRGARMFNQLAAFREMQKLGII